MARFNPHIPPKSPKIFLSIARRKGKIPSLTTAIGELAESQFKKTPEYLVQPSLPQCSFGRLHFFVCFEIPTFRANGTQGNSGVSLRIPNRSLFTGNCGSSQESQSDNTRIQNKENGRKIRSSRPIPSNDLPKPPDRHGKRAEPEKEFRPFFFRSMLSMRSLRLTSSVP